MKVLVVNSGSSSMKYQVVDVKPDQTGEVLCKGNFERIGEPATSFFTHSNAKGEKVHVSIGMQNHYDAVTRMLELVCDPKVGGVANLEDIEAIGHRAVHGADKYQKSTLATKKIIEDFEALSVLAPLHNPPNAAGVRACMEQFPGKPNFMVFDTAFHSTLPKASYMYAIPYADFEKFKIRRYGFHGTSYSFLSKRAAEMYGKPLNKLKMIIAHIGNGASVAAVKHGKSIETSMGFTPCEGIMMGTRSGDIDVGAVAHICKVHGFTIDQAVNYLNKEGGLKGLAGTGSSDMRDVMAAIEGTDKKAAARAQTAMDVFVHRLVKYIGAYSAVMDGVDCIVFTGGIGTNSGYVREKVMEKFGYLGAGLDKTKNWKLDGGCGGVNLTEEISASNARVRTFVVCTNEELEIALETQAVVLAKKK